MSDASVLASSGTAASAPHRVAVTLIGGPTALLEWGGLRILTDPTFDEPRSYGDDDPLVKTAGPAIAAADLGRIDLALVSHHHHPDNLDDSGRAVALTLPLVVTTPAGAAEFAGDAAIARVIGASDGEIVELDDTELVGSEVAERAPAGARLHVLPAQHGPLEVADRLGPVCGFLLEAPEHPTVYISGDNSSLAVVSTIAERHAHVDAALLFAGAARVDSIDATLTLTSADARAAALTLGARRVVVLHVDQWEHFREDRATVQRAFAGLESPAGEELLAATPLGERVELSL